jgi:type II secretion system protein I
MTPTLKAGILMNRDAVDNLKLSQTTAHCRGFTFIEVIVALSIVSIAIVALLQLHLVSLRMANTGRLTSQAVMLAQEKIAEQLATGFPDTDTETGIEQYNNVDFNWTTKVTDAALAPMNGVSLDGIRRISVDVKWKHGSGNKTVSLSTLTADRNL